MAEDGAGGDRYPYKTPRWILWVVALVSVGAVVAAFVVGPKDDSKTAGDGPTAPATDVIDGSGVTTAAPTTDGTTTATTKALSTTTTAPPTTTTTKPKGMTTTAPKGPTTAPKTSPPTTAPPTTAPPTTTPPVVLQPPPTAAVSVNSCRIEGNDTIIAEGTIMNQGNRTWSFTATANATDGSGKTVATVSTQVNGVQPGSTVPWTASANVGAAANQVTNCPRAGVGTAL